MKKLILIGFVLCALVLNVYSVPQNVEFGTTTTESDTVFIVVEKMPEFPGGNAKMFQFVSENIKYPRYAQENSIQGRVMVQFTVKKDGSIADVGILSSPHELLSEEAIRVIKLMPNWIPGEHKGELVNVRFVLPLVFKLDEKSGRRKSRR